MTEWQNSLIATKDLVIAPFEREEAEKYVFLSLRMKSIL